MYDVCSEMGVGGGSSGPSALSAGERTEGEGVSAVEPGSSSEERLASSSQESATGFAAGFLGLEVDGADFGRVVLLGIGRGMSCTGPFLPMARSRSVDWSSALGSDMAREAGAFGWVCWGEGRTWRGVYRVGISGNRYIGRLLKGIGIVRDWRWES